MLSKINASFSQSVFSPKGTDLFSCPQLLKSEVSHLWLSDLTGNIALVTHMETLELEATEATRVSFLCKSGSFHCQNFG